MSDFDRSLARVLVYEGGRVDDKRDPGGRTNKGVTQSTYDSYLRTHNRPLTDVWGIPDADVAGVYKIYWDQVRGDELPAGLNFAVFDAAVNSGAGRAGEWLQAALGSAYVGILDGLIGEKTIQAVIAFGDADTLIEEFCSRRLGTLKRLRTWPVYGRGWSARIANGQKIALSWRDDAAVPVVVVSAIGGHSKAPVNDGTIKAPPVQQITAHLATAGGSTATAAASVAQQFTPIQDTFAWLKYVCAGLTMLAVVLGVVVKIITDANSDAKLSQAHATVDPDADADLPTVALA